MPDIILYLSYFYTRAERERSSIDLPCGQIMLTFMVNSTNTISLVLHFQLPCSDCGRLPCYRYSASRQCGRHGRLAIPLSHRRGFDLASRHCFFFLDAGRTYSDEGMVPT